MATTARGKCYYRNLGRVSFDEFNFDHLVRYCPRRTKEYFELAANDPTRKEKPIPGVLPNIDDLCLETEEPTGKTLILADLRYINTGTKDLLCLQLLDPALDTPVELLHTVSLGVFKSLYEYDFYAKTKFSLTLKTQLLLLLNEDIKRSGCSLHFETDKDIILAPLFY
ncbi:hypothetical protein CLU79DRAFT_721648 [Phycomyces nitens]|nr:hypothetical protein CLU79DRAFT_721648 [Phycomyces nitens]